MNRYERHEPKDGMCYVGKKKGKETTEDVGSTLLDLNKI
jgi:hypothetical protein